MLTLFTIPKPFRGHFGDIQRNAIESWRALRPSLQIVLVGDEEGVEQAARDAGVEHVGGLATNERGTPRLDSAFALVDGIAINPLRCLVNADVVLLDDFLPAVERVKSVFDRFLMVGECRDLEVEAGLPLEDSTARARLRETALENGRLRGWAALDYFVFPAGEFGDLPPFLIGRACFDNWLVWRVRDQGHPVVDATRSVVAVHQSHDYSHVPGGFDETYYGDEAKYNERLAGGREHIYSLHDVTHRLPAAGRPRRYWGSTFRARERARDARARIEARRASRKTLRVLGVFPGPRSETARMLDEIARMEGVVLGVLYSESGEQAEEEPVRYDRWYPRGVRLASLERALGREYPISWAIWNSFRSFRPSFMLVSNLETFAGQAAVLWCAARRIPYVLLGRDRKLPGDGESAHALARFAARHAVAVVAVDDPAEDVAELVRFARSQRALEFG